MGVFDVSIMSAMTGCLIECVRSASYRPPSPGLSGPAPSALTDGAVTVATLLSQVLPARLNGQEGSCR